MSMKEKYIYSKIVAVTGVILTLLVLGLLIIFCLGVEAEIVSGSIYTGFNDHWGAKGNVKSPVIITREVTVESGTKLVIDPHTLVLFTGDGCIKVKGGELVVKGKEDDWIIFARLDRLNREEHRDIIGIRATFEYCYFDRLKGITICDGVVKKSIFKGIQGGISALGESTISSNLFTGCKTFFSPLLRVSGKSLVEKNLFKGNVAGNIIQINSLLDTDKVVLSKNIIKNNNGVGISVSVLDGKVTLIGNLITNNQIGIDIDVTMVGGNFIANKNAIFDNSEYNVKNSPFSQINALYNYWGDKRPDVRKFKGKINFSPWLERFPAEVPMEKYLAPTLDSLIVTLNRMAESKDRMIRGYAVVSLAVAPLKEFTKQTAKYKEAEEHTPTKPESKSKKVLTNEDVVLLVEAGLSEEVIISVIQKSPTEFDLTPEALIELKQEGVSDAIIKAMVGPSSVKPLEKAPTGTVVVMSEIGEAEVYLSDEYLGKVNEELVLPAGVHTLKIAYKDFTIEKTVKIKQGCKATVKISFPGRLHIITYTFAKTDIYESDLDISIEGEEAVAFNIKTMETSKGLFDFNAPEEVTVEKKLLLKPGKYKMFIVYAWDSSLHKYSREYTFSIYPAETTLLKTKMDTLGGAFFIEIFEKGKKVFEGR